MNKPLPYKVPLIILLILFFCKGVDALACGPDEDDLTDISLKDYYICMGGNWCRRK